MKYSTSWSDTASGAVKDTFATIACLTVDDTAGHRIRIRSVAIGPSDDTPGDLNLSVRLGRVADLSAGSAPTGGTAVSKANMPKKDTDGPDSIVAGIIAPTGEPTTYETYPGWELGVNTHGTINKEWAPEDAPVIGRDQLVGVLVAPRSTDAPIKSSGTIEFEVF
jgi:hypothetical protein